MVAKFVALYIHVAPLVWQNMFQISKSEMYNG